MNILLANDDGIDAIGLKHLYKAVEQLDGVSSITIVAPAANRSGASSALTLQQDVRIDEIDSLRFAVHGTPADCVHIALTSNFLPHKPDLILSGINMGANLGDDTIYSGTVGCAIEAHLFGLPAIAFSLISHSEKTIACAEKLTLDILQKTLARPIPNNLLLNVNIPDVSYNEIQGVKTTRLGRRNSAANSSIVQTPNGADENNNSTWHRVGNAGTPHDNAADTDFYAVENNFVSVTPLQIDLTNHKTLETVRQWFL